MKTALLHIVEGAKPKRDGQGVWRDAKLIDKAMVGFGTRDNELVWRYVPLPPFLLFAPSLRLFLLRFLFLLPTLLSCLYAKENADADPYPPL